MEDRLKFNISEEELLSLERENYISNGFLQLLIQFTSNTEYNINQDRYDEILNEYITSYIRYMIVFETIKNKYIKNNNIDTLVYINCTIDFNDRIIIFYKENK